MHIAYCIRYVIRYVLQQDTISYVALSMNESVFKHLFGYMGAVYATFVFLDNILFSYPYTFYRMLLSASINNFVDLII